MLYYCHWIWELIIWRFSCTYLPENHRIWIYVHFYRVLLVVQQLWGHPMLYHMKFTRVPRYMVIIYAYGLLERPKSATFAINLLLFYMTNTFRLLRSLWMIGGFIWCNASIPFAIWIAIYNFCFHESVVVFARLCNKSNKLPYIMPNVQNCKTRWVSSNPLMIWKAQSERQGKDFSLSLCKWVTIFRTLSKH